MWSVNLLEPIHKGPIILVSKIYVLADSILIPAVPSKCQRFQELGDRVQTHGRCNSIP